MDNLLYALRTSSSDAPSGRPSAVKAACLSEIMASGEQSRAASLEDVRGSSLSASGNPSGACYETTRYVCCAEDPFHGYIRFSWGDSTDDGTLGVKRCTHCCEDTLHPNAASNKRHQTPSVFNSTVFNRTAAKRARVVTLATVRQFDQPEQVANRSCVNCGREKYGTEVGSTRWPQRCAADAWELNRLLHIQSCNSCISQAARPRAFFEGVPLLLFPEGRLVPLSCSASFRATALSSAEGPGSSSGLRTADSRDPTVRLSFWCRLQHSCFRLRAAARLWQIAAAVAIPNIRPAQ